MQVTSDRERAIFESMNDEKKVEYLATKERLKQIAEAVHEYESSADEQALPLYHYLRARGFSNDDIWIYSPHIGGDVGADEPDWV